MNLPGQLYRAERVRELDRVAIEEYGIPGITLMERAGGVAFSALRRLWPRVSEIHVLCGAGNNGGDGYVVARLAHEQGLSVKVYLLTNAEKLKGDAKIAYDKMLQAGLRTTHFDTGMSVSSSGVIVDGLLGTGLTGDVSGHYLGAVNWINQARASGHCKVLALDIPSGLHADRGVIQGCAVIADATVTFIGVKQGLLTADGPDHCGELIYHSLDVNPDVFNKIEPSCELLSIDLPGTTLPARKRNSHKSDFGHVLVIGGNDGMIGAVRLAAEAALRAGSGLVSVATRPEHVTAIVSQRPEIMCHGVASHHQLIPLIDKVDCIAIGPGLGTDAWADEIMSRVLQCSQPLVVDADALNLLSKDKMQRKNWVLTPHPGEAGRLLGVTTGEIQQDRFQSIKELRRQYGGAVLLKGVGTLIIDETEKVYLCPYGNPGMASGGMGDVLTGVTVAFLAQGLSPGRAACLAAVVHARAADLAAQAGGVRGLMATDLMNHIRALVNPGQAFVEIQ